MRECRDHLTPVPIQMIFAITGWVFAIPDGFFFFNENYYLTTYNSLATKQSVLELSVVKPRYGIKVSRQERGSGFLSTVSARIFPILRNILIPMVIKGAIENTAVSLHSAPHIVPLLFCFPYAKPNPCLSLDRICKYPMVSILYCIVCQA